MNEYKHNEDNIRELGFISKSDILKYVTEEDIYELVFKFKPIEFEYITSPIRVDTNAGCWFERDIQSDKLLFRDFAYGKRPLDCFDIIQKYYCLNNFYETLKFVKEKLIEGKNIEHKILEVKRTVKKKAIKKSKFDILIQTRDFIPQDRKFWNPYEIKKLHLIEDKVFPVRKFKLLNTKKGNINVTPKSVTYCYMDFVSGRKKLYAPYEKNHKFSTTCLNDDIGGYHKLPPFGRQLVITKSYKDYRVLKNQGLNVVWFQNEGMFPSEKLLIDLCKRFRNIIIFFDNDRAGIEVANILKNIINKMFPNKARLIHLNVELLKWNTTDPSDLIKKRGKKDLLNFLTYHKIL